MRNRILPTGTELLQLFLPGRRRLRQNQQLRADIQNQLRLRLLTEYQSLAGLPSTGCDTKSLGTFDRLKFFAWLKQKDVTHEWPDIEKKVANFAIPEMAGGVNAGDQRLIYSLCKYLRPRRILEVGTHIGASSIHIALASKMNGDSCELTTVDIRDVNCSTAMPWKSAGASFGPAEMMKRLECSHLVRFVASDSVDFLANDTSRFNLIFLDGDHSAASVYRELPLALQRLADGGIILLHDYFPDLRPLWPEQNATEGDLQTQVLPGVFLAVQRLLNEGVKLQITPMGALPWPTKLGSSVTSLAIVSRPI